MLVPPHQPRVHTQQGFTLIEIAVVVALMALLSGIAIAKLQGPYRRARWTATLQQIEQLDQLVRSRARHSKRPSRLVVDLKRQRLLAYDPTTPRKRLSEVILGSIGKIERVFVHGRTARAGRVTIPVGPQGQTASYALQIKSAEQDPTWLLFTARTGQMITLENDREVREILQPQATDRAHAH